MNVNEVTKILGQADINSENDNSICYKIENLGFVANDYYCLTYDKNHEIIETDHNY